MSGYQGEVSIEEAARLMCAVAKKNVFKRGKKSRMDCYKDFFGVYVSYSYKFPTAILRGRNWRMEFVVSHHSQKDIDRAHKFGTPLPTAKAYVFPQPPSPDEYKRIGRGRNKKFQSRTPRIYGQAILTLRVIEGDKFFLKDWMLLRMFESEWENTPAPEEAQATLASYGGTDDA